jgi:hypothetical protein
MDIPEAFRRAFEEAEGGDKGSGGGNDGGDSGSGGGRRTGPPWWTNRWLWISLLILIFLLSFNWIVTTYTEWLWLTALNFQNVWLTQWGIRMAAFGIFFVLGAVIILVNWRIAFNNARKSPSISRIQILALPGINWLLTSTGLFLAFVFASAAATQWERFLRQGFDQLAALYAQAVADAEHADTLGLHACHFARLRPAAGGDVNGAARLGQRV